MTTPAWNAADATKYVDFALRWLPYGGGDAEDILVTFGLPARAFFQRLRVIAQDSRTDLPDDLRRRIGAMCVVRASRPAEPFVDR